MFAEALIVTEEMYDVGESHNFPRTFAPYFTISLLSNIAAKLVAAIDQQETYAKFMNLLIAVQCIIWCKISRTYATTLYNCPMEESLWILGQQVHHHRIATSTLGPWSRSFWWFRLITSYFGLVHLLIHFFKITVLIFIISWMNLNTIPDQRWSHSEGHLQKSLCFSAPTQGQLFDQISPAGHNSKCFCIL